MTPYLVAVLLATQTQPVSLPNRFVQKPAEPVLHAHNDYRQKRPLLDALENRCRSIEVDIFLVDGELRVGHDRKDLVAGRTLTALYLEPLADRVKRLGSIYGDGKEVTLMIDIKADGEKVYPVLKSELARYEDWLTHFEDNRIDERAVAIVLSGDSPRRLVAQEPTRLVAIDGRPEDLVRRAPVGLVPWISAAWLDEFRWLGVGPIPGDQAARLTSLGRQARQQGRRLRFWGMPASEDVWRTALQAGMNLLNADDLPKARRLLDRLSSR